MAFLTALQVSGDAVALARTHSAHIPGKFDPVDGGRNGDFGELLLRAMNGVNALQIESDRLSTQMITDPDSVEAHDVTIAMSKANLAVSMTKSVVDRALQAYSNIINMR